MESYVRGLMTANADQKMKLFSQAVRIDEHFSQPNFQLGKMLFAKKEYRPAGQNRTCCRCLTSSSLRKQVHGH